MLHVFAAASSFCCRVDVRFGSRLGLPNAGPGCRHLLCGFLPRGWDQAFGIHHIVANHHLSLPQRCVRYVVFLEGCFDGKILRGGVVRVLQVARYPSPWQRDIRWCRPKDLAGPSVSQLAHFFLAKSSSYCAVVAALDSAASASASM